MVDAFLTLVTWLPKALYWPIIQHLGDSLYDTHSWHTILTVEEVLLAIMLTNMFSTPIVYFLFNRGFRVS